MKTKRTNSNRWTMCRRRCFVGQNLEGHEKKQPEKWQSNPNPNPCHQKLQEILQIGWTHTERLGCKRHADAKKRFSDSDSGNEFPVELLAYFLPYFILFNAFLSVLQHGEIGQELALVQQLAQLVHGVVIIQEVDAVFRAELGIRPLNFHEQVAQRFLQFGRHDGWFDAQLLLDERDVLVVLVVSQLLQNFLRLFVGELRVQVNSLLFNLVFYVFQNVGRNLRGFLGLELRQNFLEVVDALVSVKARLLGRLFV